LTDLFGVDNAGQASAAMRMSVKQWQCKETCSETRCQRRLRAENKEPGDKARSLLNKREVGGDVEARSLKGGRGGRSGGRSGSRSGSSKSCNEVCVAYSHEKILSEEIPTTSFNDPQQAETICGAGFSSLGAPGVQGHDVHVPGGQIATANGNGWTVNRVQVQELPINVAVPLTARAPWRSGSGPSASDFTDSPSAPDLNRRNTYVAGNVLRTCKSSDMGCYEITFLKAVPNRISMLGAVSTVPGEMSVTGWNNEGFWLCKVNSTNNINRFCPSESSVDMRKGMISCGEDITTVAQMVTMLKDANWYAQWGYRIGGFVILLCAFNCCFLPIKACLGFITDMIDDGTECIPCVGSCVDFLTDIFMKMVSAILAVVSCCCACGTFLAVCAVMWIVLKPWYGIPMMIGVCCFCGGAGALLYFFRGSKDDESELLDEEEDEEEMSDYDQDN